MDQKLQQIVDIVRPFRDRIQTVQDVRRHLVARVIGALGYDVSNESEVVIGFTLDWMVRSEAIDFAVLRSGTPAILFECRSPGESMRRRSSLLGHCFAQTGATVAVVTDGTTYRFYTDYTTPGVLDAGSFVSLSIDAPDPISIRLLNVLTREHFDADAVREIAAVSFVPKPRRGPGGRPASKGGGGDRYSVALRGEYRDRVETLRLLIRKERGVDILDKNRVVQWSIDESIRRLSQ